jgi:hypothetical protein
MLSRLEEQIVESAKAADNGAALFEHLTTLLGRLPDGSTSSSMPSLPSGVKVAGWRKDLKLSGQIGDWSGSLGYMSFLRLV